jgi:hypothetical protein
VGMQEVLRPDLGLLANGYFSMKALESARSEVEFQEVPGLLRPDLGPLADTLNRFAIFSSSSTKLPLKLSKYIIKLSIVADLF